MLQQCMYQKNKAPIPVSYKVNPKVKSITVAINVATVYQKNKAPIPVSQVIVGCTLQQRDNSTLPIGYSISFYASR